MLFLQLGGGVEVLLESAALDEELVSPFGQLFVEIGIFEELYEYLVRVVDRGAVGLQSLAGTAVGREPLNLLGKLALRIAEEFFEF